MSSNNLALTSPWNWNAGSEYGASSSPDRDLHRSRQQQGVPWPLNYRLEEDGGGMYAPWRLFEERVRTGPYGITRFPLQPYSPIRILILEGGPGERVNPRLRQFIRDSPPRIQGDWNLGSAPVPEEEEEHGLTDEEFRDAMKNLKKQVYNPPINRPKKKKPRMRGLFSTRIGTSTTSNHADQEEGRDDDGKQCTICLEDLVRNQQVLTTPCSHVFHHGCLVPWVKGRGRCPVCRLALCERRRRRQRALSLSTTHNITVLSEEEEADMELAALIRAAEEAFNWVHLN